MKSFSDLLFMVLKTHHVVTVLKMLLGARVKLCNESGTASESEITLQASPHQSFPGVIKGLQHLALSLPLFALSCTPRVTFDPQGQTQVLEVGLGIGSFHLDTRRVLGERWVLFGSADPIGRGSLCPFAWTENRE